MCGDYNLRREKRYVEVDVRFTPDGSNFRNMYSIFSALESPLF